MEVRWSHMTPSFLCLSLTLSLSFFNLFSIVSVNIHQLNIVHSLGTSLNSSSILALHRRAEAHPESGDSGVQQCCVISYCTHATGHRLAASINRPLAPQLCLPGSWTNCVVLSHGREISKPTSSEAPCLHPFSDHGFGQEYLE